MPSRMARDPAVGRYRRWYARLLRLYPRRFQARFAEPMAQTFSDLCHERTDAKAGLRRLVVELFAEAAVGIIRENLAHMTTQIKPYLRWVLITAAVLAVPALAMTLNLAFPDPGSGTRDGVNWGPLDFAVAGILVLGGGLLYEYAKTRAGSVAHRVAAGIAVLAGVGLVWVNLAVGMMDVENGNLMYVLVLFVALVGTAIGRFEPQHASNAMFVTAAVHAAVAVIALAVGFGPTLLADAFFVAAWVACGVLFRQARVASPSSP